MADELIKQIRNIASPKSSALPYRSGEESPFISQGYIKGLEPEWPPTAREGIVEYEMKSPDAGAEYRRFPTMPMYSQIPSNIQRSAQSNYNFSLSTTKPINYEYEDEDLVPVPRYRKEEPEGEELEEVD